MDSIEAKGGSTCVKHTTPKAAATQTIFHSRLRYNFQELLRCHRGEKIATWIFRVFLFFCTFSNVAFSGQDMLHKECRRSLDLRHYRFHSSNNKDSSANLHLGSYTQNSVHVHMLESLRSHKADENGKARNNTVQLYCIKGAIK